MTCFRKSWKYEKEDRRRDHRTSTRYTNGTETIRRQERREKGSKGKKVSINHS